MKYKTPSNSIEWMVNVPTRKTATLDLIFTHNIYYKEFIKLAQLKNNGHCCILVLGTR